MELSHVAGTATDARQRSNSTNSTPIQNHYSASRTDHKKAKAISDAIDKSLKIDKERMQKETGIKLLILGPAETGKTTVLKQLKLMYGRKGLDAERETYRRIVHLNVMKAIQALIEGLEEANIPLEDPANIPHLDMVADHLESALKKYSVTSIHGFTNPAIPRKITDAKAETDMFAEMAPAIKALWADDSIQKIFHTCTQLNIQDSAKYFLDTVDRISHPEYIPSDDDILQARVKTLAVTEHVFHIENVAYRIYDVGGQKSLRKYWA